MLQGRRCCRKILFDTLMYVIHLLLTDDATHTRLDSMFRLFRIPENTQVMPVLVVPGTTDATPNSMHHAPCTML